jgi:hypothetical protein
MTMPANLPPDRGTTQSIRVEIGILLMKLRRLANYWIAIAFARRQRQAEPGAEPHLGSEDPGEFGIYRYQVGGGPTNASQRRLNDPNPRPRDDPERVGTRPRRKVYSKPARCKPST